MSKAKPPPKIPPNCGTGYCSCIECLVPKTTVLPYMGKPKQEVERDARRKKFKSAQAVGDGVVRTPAHIKEDWREV